MSKVVATIKHEFLEMLPPTIYFFIILHIVAIIRALMVKGTGIELETTASVAIAALILGKAVLLADMLPFINRFPEKPLIWNVAWKTIMYSIVALIIHYLERLYDFWKEAPGFAAANKLLLSEINWPRFWAVQILLLTLVLMYCVLAEMARAIGREKFKRAFFGPLPADLAERRLSES